MYYLLTHPDQFEAVRNDPSLIPNFIDETLRYLTPVNNMWRTVAKDTTLGGVALTKGEMIFLRFGSGDRDETQFPDADRYDVTRPTPTNTWRSAAASTFAWARNWRARR